MRSIILVALLFPNIAQEYDPWLKYTKACEALCQTLYKQKVIEFDEVSWERVSCRCAHEGAAE